jgi:hypothetical protein
VAVSNAACNTFDLVHSMQNSHNFGYLRPMHNTRLTNNFFDLNIKGKVFSSKAYGFVCYNKIVRDTFLELGFPSGKKSVSVKVPESILYSKNKELSFLGSKKKISSYLANQMPEDPEKIISGFQHKIMSKKKNNARNTYESPYSSMNNNSYNICIWITI